MQMEMEKKEFGYISVKQNQEELEEFYKNEYFQKHKDGFLKDRIIPDSQLEEVKDSLEEIDELEWLIRTEYGRVREVVEREMTELPKNLLDIGCGAGHFLNYMKGCGWEVEGIEPSNVFREDFESKGLEVFSGTLEEYSKKKDKKFSLITLNHVLEHITNPLEVIEQCKQLLRDDGYIYIKVPNDFNKFQEIGNSLVNKKDWWVAIPDHVNYFTHESLDNILEAFEFKIIHHTTDFPMELFLLCGKNYIDNSILGKECHKIRKNLEIRLGENLLEQLYEKLAEINLGRNVMIIGKLNKKK